MKQARNITGDVNDTLINSLDDSQYSAFQKFWFGFLTDDVCLLIYTGLLAVVIPLIVGRAIYFFNWFVSASNNLHNNMFSKIVHAPMRFFNLNPSGRILNRFSKDINMVDEYLPVTLSDTVQVNAFHLGVGSLLVGNLFQIGLMIGANIIVVSTVIPFILLPTGVILVIFYLIRTVFIATSRDIKRFESLSKSFVYNSFIHSFKTDFKTGHDDLTEKKSTLNTGKYFHSTLVVCCV